MELEGLLQDFDTLDKKNFDEFDFMTALNSIIPSNGEELINELKAELMAFQFCENYTSSTTGWGTYFGPTWVLQNEEGQMVEYPSLKLVTEEILRYWESRANSAVNPILKARYAGLVWDFQEKVLGSKPSYKICILYIEALTLIATGKFYKRDVCVFIKLKRALELACSHRHAVLIEAAKIALIEFEDQVAVDDMGGLWGYCYDLLLFNKAIKLSLEEENKIINDLEQRLRLLIQNELDFNNNNRNPIKFAAERLSKYYKKYKRISDLNRIVSLVGDQYENWLLQESGLKKNFLLEDLRLFYLNYGLIENAEAILNKIRENSASVSSELKEMKFEYKIPNDVIQEYINPILVSNEIHDILHKIAVRHIPVKQNESELLRNEPIGPSSFVSTEIIDSKGRVTAKLAPLNDDFENNLIHRISRKIGFISPFINILINEVVNRKMISSEVVINFIFDCPLIDKDRFPIIEQALEAYFNRNYIVFLHLIIPQIEEAVRNILEFSGGKVLKEASSGGYHLRTFDDVLRDNIVIGALGEDMSFYFRVLFTNQYGLNLRNDICHGISSLKTFNARNSDRVFHALLCLGLIKYTVNP